jgi:hypothetical protein
MLSSAARAKKVFIDTYCAGGTRTSCPMLDGPDDPLRPTGAISARQSF